MTRRGGFEKEQYGLISVFIAVAQLMFSLSSLGMPAFIGKFFPYYKAHLPEKKNDQLSIAFAFTLAGFFVVLLLGLLFKDVVANKMFSNSPELLNYYYWLFPFGFGFTIFMLLEAYCWQRSEAVLSNFLKEVIFRAFATVLILLTAAGLIKSFDNFIGLYSFVYIVLFSYLLFYFKRKGQLNFTTRISVVTKKFRKKIIVLASFVWGGSLVFNIASVIDTLVIAAVLPNGMAAAAVFTVAQYMASLIQAPQRAIISSAIGPLSQAWRDKDYRKLNKIYHRSAINQLLFSTAMFSLIWLNFEDGVNTLNLQKDYLAAKWIFFYLGLTRILDMGTGLNAQIIGTSTYWKYEFKTGVILLCVSVPLNYFLTIKFGAIGPAMANLVAFTIYNGIRYLFLLNKFNMQPFDAKNGLTILLAAACFCIAYFPTQNLQGLPWLAIRSLLFIIPFAFGMITMKLSPDAIPVWETVKKKLKIS